MYTRIISISLTNQAAIWFEHRGDNFRVVLIKIPTCGKRVLCYLSQKYRDVFMQSVAETLK